MVNQGQNSQIELLSKLALRGGGYSWNAVPISDNGEPDPSFYISQPEEPLRKQMLAAARRRNDLILAEPRVPTEEYEAVGGRNPYTAPASVVPHQEGEGPGEGLSLTNPRPDRFKNFAGSGESEKLPQLDALDKEELFKQLDRLLGIHGRKQKKRNRDERAPHGANRVVGYVGTSGIEREAEDEPERGGEEWKREADRRESTRVAGDRSPAFDVSAVLPFESEVLQHWHKWLYTKIDSQHSQRRNLDRLHEFLARVKGGNKFGDLHWKDKEELAEIMRCFVEAEERAEAQSAA